MLPDLPESSCSLTYLMLLLPALKQDSMLSRYLESSCSPCNRLSCSLAYLPGKLMLPDIPGELMLPALQQALRPCVCLLLKLDTTIRKCFNAF